MTAKVHGGFRLAMSYLLLEEDGEAQRIAKLTSCLCPLRWSGSV